MIRRIVLTVALMTATIGITSSIASAAPASWNYRKANVQACPSSWWKTHSRTAVRNLIICEAHLFGVSSSTATYVANRESRYYWRAYNNGGCGGVDCGGIFQHSMNQSWGWYPRVHDFAHRFRLAWYNVRTQCVVTMKMVRQGGWGPWGM